MLAPMRRIFYSLLPFSFFLFPSILHCQADSTIIKAFSQHFLQIQKRFAPDLTLNILSAALSKDESGWILEGETTLPEAQQALIRSVDSLIAPARVSNQIKILPDSALGDSIYAIVTVSTAHLRSESEHAAEMIDESIMGNSLRLLKKEGMWYLCQTECSYIGWVTRYSILRITNFELMNWQNSKRVRVKALVDFIYSEKDEESEPVCDVVLNVTLKELNRFREWTKVETPDGRVGFIENEDIEPYQGGKKFSEVSSKQIIHTARHMFGIPYLWGGNTTKGNDCSGFVQTVFKANGLQLPRDARQQALIGEEVIPDEDFSNVLPADLLFFGHGERITHVGISLGGYLFIHQDSDIHVNSFNEKDKNYNPSRKRTLKKIKRVLRK